MLIEEAEIRRQGYRRALVVVDLRLFGWRERKKEVWRKMVTEEERERRVGEERESEVVAAIAMAVKTVVFFSL